MKANERIKKYIQKRGAGKPFSAKTLYPLASTDNVRQVLARMVKSGELRRLARGVFVKPKQVIGVGELLPSVSEITEVIAHSSGETIAIHGAEAARQLQLTTQVPMQLVYYTNGTSRKLKIGARTVEFKHVSPNKLLLSGTLAGTVVSALSYLGREQVTTQTIQTIQRRLEKQEFASVVQQVEHMPGWMANTFHHYQARERYE